MPDERDPIREPDNEFTELAKQLGGDLPEPGELPAESDRIRLGVRWDDFDEGTPIGRVGDRVGAFRRIRFGRPVPPFKSGPFRDDDGCLRGCFYPLGCLFWVLVAILVVVLATIFWLDGGGDGGDGNLVSGGGFEASPSASASPEPSAEPTAAPTEAATEEPSPEPTEEPSPEPTATPSGPITVTGTSAVDHPPFARTYSNVGASVLLACLSGDADLLAGLAVSILFGGAGLSDTTLEGEFDSNGRAVIEVPIQNFGPFQWSANYAHLSDGTMLELSGGDSGEVGSDENPDACGS